MHTHGALQPRAPAHTCRLTVRLSRRHESWVYLTWLALLATGAGWLIAHYFFMHRGELGLEPSPAEPWYLRLHGAAVLGFLVVFGALLPGHVLQGWRQRLKHRSGAPLVAAVAVLAVTGYGLYYIVDDWIRSWIGVAHWITGLAASAGLLVHVLRSRSMNKR